VKTLGSPIKLSHQAGESAPRDLGRGAPTLGQHTREVLLEAGIDAAEVDALIESGIALQATAG
jgi:crotonobetainyl-CoA:carnitine CoA-transferase CaiB-like acyl-CoA transferase